MCLFSVCRDVEEGVGLFFGPYGFMYLQISPCGLYNLVFFFFFFLVSNILIFSYLFK